MNTAARGNFPTAKLISCGMLERAFKVKNNKSAFLSHERRWKTSYWKIFSGNSRTIRNSEIFLQLQGTSKS